MIAELRVLGISPELKGTGIMEKMLYGTISPEELTYKNVKEVLYSWDTRNFVPTKMLEDEKEGKIKIDRVSPAITQEEVESGCKTQEEYDRDYVRLISAYIHTIWV